MKLKNILSIVAAIVLLTGCGGNSSSSSSSNETSSAQLVDSPVINVDYITDSLQGVTDENGYFTYSKNDKKVIFKVGDLIIAEFNLSKLNHDHKIFPADLVDVNRTNVTNENLLKIIRFLQTLDEDNNVSNGITISDNVKDEITQLLENNQTFNNNLNENNLTLLKNMMKQLNKKLILERTAINNYREELKNYNIITETVPFTMVWNVPSSNLNVTINADTTNYEYNYTIDWGDGNVDYEVNESVTHTYTKEGNYTIKITGVFPHVSIHDTRLEMITKWGDIHWKSFESSFSFSVNMNINATDTPNMKEVTDLSEMFLYSDNFNSDISEWDVSSITDMSGMFFHAVSFNQPLNDWNVRNVTNMRGMFSMASNFNQPLNDWDVSSVTDMSYMFQEASNFNQSLNDWDVNSVTDMSNMFKFASNFNQPLNNWDVSSVINMSSMFWGAKNFNQPLNNWDVSSVTNMSSMFKEASSFNQLLSDWDVSSVTDMSYMFYRAVSFNQPLALWDVSSVTNMNYMFQEAISFNQPLSLWDVSSVIQMNSMFYKAISFDQNISTWNVSSVLQYTDFDKYSPIEGTSKEPNFQ